MTHQTVGERGEVLTSDDLAALRDNLQEQRQFREEQLRQFAADSAFPADDPCAADEDEARGVGQIEVSVKLAASARMVLADVEAALTRMDMGTYGTCHLCRRPVQRERLLIVPQARYCARCQQVREAAR